MRQELGDTYVDQLRELYGERVPGGADLVVYWFERSRTLSVEDRVKRVGLLATNSIRGGANRHVLDRIKQVGDIFMAWSDRPWILDGAAVRVSMVGFDKGQEIGRTLNGKIVGSIGPDLTGDLDLTMAQRLAENQRICLLGAFKFGAFDIDAQRAIAMLEKSANPNGRSNSDVIKPWVNGLDITRRPRNMWIINFGTMSEEEASLYEVPFEYVKRHVKPERDNNRRDRRRIYWWQHGETSPSLYAVLSPLSRYIVSPRVAKHRLFVWVDRPTIPDMQVIVFARDDDYFLGVLHSKVHELWSLRLGTSLEDRPRYTPTTTFETFPFPWPPGKEPQDDPKVKAIGAAAARLVELRDNWLNPPGLNDANVETQDPASLRKRTLTNLYNANPQWLQMAHQTLDRAVLDAYGWPHNLSDDEILARLLALNLARAAGQGVVQLAMGTEVDEGE